MLLDRRLAEAERVSAEALCLALKVHPANAEQAHLLQTLALRREQGRLAELKDTVGRCIRRYPGIPGWRCILAHLHAELGRHEDAARELDDLSAARFATIPYDAIWLGAIAHLAEACAALGNARHAATLYALLEPYADRNVVIRLGICMSGLRRAATWPIGCHARTARPGRLTFRPRHRRE